MSNAQLMLPWHAQANTRRGGDAALTADKRCHSRAFLKRFTGIWLLPGFPSALLNIYILDHFKFETETSRPVIAPPFASVQTESPPLLLILTNSVKPDNRSPPNILMFEFFPSEFKHGKQASF